METIYILRSNVLGKSLAVVLPPHLPQFTKIIKSYDFVKNQYRKSY